MSQPRPVRETAANLLHLLPFSYAYSTRFRGGVAFHAVFEWAAAAFLLLTLGQGEPARSLWAGLVSYFAFISIYELGYMYNDLVASRREKNGRHRGPKDAGASWLFCWCVSRLLFFLVLSFVGGHLRQLEWWSFFGALAAVFVFHNLVRDLELRVTSFIWLAWFRFMAPVIFVIAKDQRMGVGLAAALAYVIFRSLGYLDAKGFLKLAGRKGMRFRLIFFLMPMAGVAALWPYAEARGFVLLTVFFAAASAIGVAAFTATSKLKGADTA